MQKVFEYLKILQIEFLNKNTQTDKKNWNELRATIASHGKNDTVAF